MTAAHMWRARRLRSLPDMFSHCLKFHAMRGGSFVEKKFDSNKFVTVKWRPTHHLFCTRMPSTLLHLGKMAAVSIAAFCARVFLHSLFPLSFWSRACPCGGGVATNAQPHVCQSCFVTWHAERDRAEPSLLAAPAPVSACAFAALRVRFVLGAVFCSYLVSH